MTRCNNGQSNIASLITGYISEEINTSSDKAIRTVYTSNDGRTIEFKMLSDEIESIEHAGNSLNIPNSVCCHIRRKNSHVIYRYHIPLINLIAFGYSKLR